MAFPIGKNKVSVNARSAGEFGETIYNGLRDGELSPSSTFDDEAGAQAQKIVGALNIPGRTKADGREAAGLHGISVLFMILVDLAVRAKRSPTVVFVVKAMTKNQFTRTPAR